jgi:hypothetical protein
MLKSLPCRWCMHTTYFDQCWSSSVLFLIASMFFIRCKMFGLFALLFLVDNPCISFGKCHVFISVYLRTLFYYVLYCVSCSECYFCVSLRSFVIFCFFTAVCKSGPFGFQVLWISVFNAFILCLCCSKCR